VSIREIEYYVASLIDAVPWLRFSKRMGAVQSPWPFVPHSEVAGMDERSKMVPASPLPDVEASADGPRVMVIDSCLLGQ
jgi:hypothetical protein